MKKEVTRLQKALQDKKKEIQKLKVSGKEKDQLLKAFAEERRKQVGKKPDTTGGRQNKTTRNQKKRDEPKTTTPKTRNQPKKQQQKKREPVEKKQTQRNRPQRNQPRGKNTSQSNKNTADRQKNWWSKLESQWKMAFNVVLGNEERTAMPPAEQLAILWKINALIFNAEAGEPGLKLSYKLTNLSGVYHLTQLERLDIKSHQIRSLKGLEKLQQLKHLNLSGNKMSNLAGIEKLPQLKSLDASYNKLENLDGVEKLQYLTQLNVQHNQIPYKSFDNIYQGMSSLAELHANANGLSMIDKVKMRKLRSKIKVVKF